MTLRLIVPLVMIASLSSSRAGAQVLWYNGDPAGRAFYSQHSPPFFTALSYDNFVVSEPTWRVSGFFGNFIVTGHKGAIGSTGTTAYWEIRTGMSNGSGGTLLYSGTDALSSWGPSGFDLPDAPGYNGFYGEITGFAPFSLGAGSYWLGIAPTFDYEAPGTLVFAWFTSGANGTNALTDQTFNFNWHHAAGYSGFHPGASPGAYAENFLGQQTDLSYGVLGTVTPEPATVILLGTGLLVIGLLTWRGRLRAQIRSGS